MEYIALSISTRIIYDQETLTILGTRIMCLVDVKPLVLQNIIADDSEVFELARRCIVD